MKTAVIITPFDNYSYNVRIRYIEKYIRDLGYEDIVVISSDWNHRDKTPYQIKRENLVLLHVPTYKKNMSLNRVYSHYILAKEVHARLKTISPNFIYLSAPPNFLVKFVAQYIKEHANVKAICELGDLWPETLPISGWKKAIALPLLKIWAYLRNHYIKSFNGIIYECNLFKDIVGNSINYSLPSKTIYLCKEDSITGEIKEFIDFGIVEVAYIGSINNLIDIDLTVKILSAINKRIKVIFHIIGDGENASKLYELCESEGVEYINHGIIYDDIEKYSILKRCMFGLNIMKTSVVVGVTMKSLEYFHWGMALINNIPADTSEIVDRYGCGFNIYKDDVEAIAQAISLLTPLDISFMCKQSRNVYLNLFDEKIISKEFINFCNLIIND